jgi:SOS response regulatory protein OraA/RecX
MAKRRQRDGTSPQDALAVSLRLLAGRDLSVHQLQQRLEQRGFETPAIEQAVSRLAAAGTLDDARVARAVARTRAGVKRQGRARVVRELGAIGIPRDIAEQTVREVFGELDEDALLEQALDRRLRRSVSLSDPAARRRLQAALVRQGFSPAAAMRAIRARLSVAK